MGNKYNDWSGVFIVVKLIDCALPSVLFMYSKLLETIGSLSGLRIFPQCGYSVCISS